ncbi:MAG: exonuclease SbcCD subunit D [Acidaminococcaceae bacterium]|nr:exonuclease SbcCD subunit D [Acidaminococcaceae bacterium]MBR1511573.1 exonuclease SbcCD subunit D [Acidaminococcaceae bacterium]
MNFFHLSDLHIGLKLLNRDMREDQEYILKQIADLAGEKQPDAVVIAGDIYDKAVPSAEAVEVFDKFISRLNEAAPRAEIMIVSGNHDSGTRVNLFRSVLQRHKIHIIGLPPQTPEEYIEKVTMPDEFGNVNFYLLPFVKPSMLKAIVGTDESGNNLTYDETLRRLLQRENINTRERNVLVSHQFYLPAGTDPDEVERMDSEIVTVGNVDEVCADVLQPFDYAALGHIHKPMQVGSDRFRYCGTPLACSVSEAGQQKGIIWVKIGAKGNVGTEVLPLMPLRQVRVIRGDLEEVLQQGSDDYVTVVLTDKRDYDVIDMKDRLYHAFPNLLEIRRDVQRTVDYSLRREAAEKLAPFDLCNAFLKDLDEEEKMILRDVINAAQNGEGQV